MALLAWLAYLVLGLGVMPLIFRLRFSRWPFAVPLIPRNRYDVAEHVYALVIGASTLVPVVQDHICRPLPPRWWQGLTLMVLGLALQIWSVVTLGPWWRIGQEPGERVENVHSGPYRWFRHPIYVSLTMIVLGEAFLCGFEVWSLILLVTTVIYSLIQGPLESRRLARQSPG